MRSERLRERKPLTHKTGIKWVKCCGAVAFLKLGVSVFKRIRLVFFRVNPKNVII